LLRHAKGKDFFEIVKVIDAKMLSQFIRKHPEMYVRDKRQMTVVNEGGSYAL
jgi:hypothetical protein